MSSTKLQVILEEDKKPFNDAFSIVLGNQKLLNISTGRDFTDYFENKYSSVSNEDFRTMIKLGIIDVRSDFSDALMLMCEKLEKEKTS